VEFLLQISLIVFTPASPRRQTVGALLFIRLIDSLSLYHALTLHESTRSFVSF